MDFLTVVSGLWLRLRVTVRSDLQDRVIHDSAVVLSAATYF